MRNRLLAGLLCLTSSIPALARCGVERWSVKTGTDADVTKIDLSAAPHPSTIGAFRQLSPPSPIPKTRRFGPVETTVWTVDATLTDYKIEDNPSTGDSDYHLVLQDGAGKTIVAEIPSPDCVDDSSPFRPFIAKARAAFDSRLTATGSFQTANVSVRVVGVGFFDFAHGQRGAAPNVFELHPILDITFEPGSAPPSFLTTPTAASSQPSPTTAAQWEYKLVSAATAEELLPAVSQEGGSGWEMVSAVVDPARTDKYVAYLKRHK